MPGKAKWFFAYEPAVLAIQRSLQVSLVPSTAPTGVGLHDSFRNRAGAGAANFSTANTDRRGRGAFLNP